MRRKRVGLDTLAPKVNYMKVSNTLVEAVAVGNRSKAVDNIQLAFLTKTSSQDTSSRRPWVKT